MWLFRDFSLASILLEIIDVSRFYYYIYALTAYLCVLKTVNKH